MKKTHILSASLLAFPLVASAEFTGIKGIITSIGGLVKQLTAIAAGVGLLAFFWGIAKFIMAAGGDEKAISQGKKFMGWGLIGLFVMMSVWGIIGFMQSELGLTRTTGGSVQNTPTSPFGDSTFKPLEPRRGSVTQPIFGQ